jgi:hypothetical protein
MYRYKYILCDSFSMFVAEHIDCMSARTLAATGASQSVPGVEPVNLRSSRDTVPRDLPPGPLSM